MGNDFYDATQKPAWKERQQVIASNMHGIPSFAKSVEGCYAYCARDNLWYLHQTARLTFAEEKHATHKGK